MAAGSSRCPSGVDSMLLQTVAALRWQLCPDARTPGTAACRRPPLRGSACCSALDQWGLSRCYTAGRLQRQAIASGVLGAQSRAPVGHIATVGSRVSGTWGLLLTCLRACARDCVDIGRLGLQHSLGSQSSFEWTSEANCVQHGTQPTRVQCLLLQQTHTRQSAISACYSNKPTNGSQQPTTNQTKNTSAAKLNKQASERHAAAPTVPGIG